MTTHRQRRRATARRWTAATRRPLSPSERYWAEVEAASRQWNADEADEDGWDDEDDEDDDEVASPWP